MLYYPCSQFLTDSHGDVYKSGKLFFNLNIHLYLLQQAMYLNSIEEKVFHITHKLDSISILHLCIKQLHEISTGYHFSVITRISYIY